MHILFSLLTRFMCSEVSSNGRQRGATMIEYALIVAVVSIAIVLAASTLFEGSLEGVGTAVSNAISGGSTDP